MTKPVERGVARQLRAEHGLPVKRIATELSVSPGSVSYWVRDIEITPPQRARNLSRSQEARNKAWRERNRARRPSYQTEGRARARTEDPLHRAGCMLYWAEGSKGRNTVIFANSDPNMLRFFRAFLSESMQIPDQDLSMRLNVYLGNGRTLDQIERYWLDLLELPRSCLRKHTVNHFPTSSSGGKAGRLRHGVCTLKVLRSTRHLQHIYGAIQEYAGFEEPRWIDGLY